MMDYVKRDGSVYSGQMKKKEFSQFLFISHGYGTQKFLDGSVYAGDWINGLCEGKGSLTFKNGMNFMGLFY